MIIATTPASKLLLRQFIGKDEINKIPELNYNPNNQKQGIIRCKYSMYYLEQIFKLLKADAKGESVWLMMKEDYPLTFETENWTIILAPRVERE